MFRLILLMVAAALLVQPLYGSPTGQIVPFFYGYMALTVVFGALGALLSPKTSSGVFYISSIQMLLTGADLAAFYWSLWPLLVVGVIFIAWAFIYRRLHPEKFVRTPTPTPPLTLLLLLKQALIGFIVIAYVGLWLNTSLMLIEGRFDVGEWLARIFLPAVIAPPIVILVRNGFKPAIIHGPE